MSKIDLPTTHNSSIFCKSQATQEKSQKERLNLSYQADNLTPSPSPSISRASPRKSRKFLRKLKENQLTRETTKEISLQRIIGSRRSCSILDQNSSLNVNQYSQVAFNSILDYKEIETNTKIFIQIPLHKQLDIDITSSDLSGISYQTPRSSETQKDLISVIPQKSLKSGLKGEITKTMKQRILLTAPYTIIPDEHKKREDPPSKKKLWIKRGFGGSKDIFRR